jgi:uncharacterized protein (DUF433 family)
LHMKGRTKMDLLELPNYGLPEASLYLHVPISTLRYWVLGTEADRPLVRLASRHPRSLLSFKNLIECYVLEVIRLSHKIGLRTIRYSLATALSKYPSPHPFADYSLTTHNGHIYLDERDLVDLSKGGQFAFREFMDSSFRRVDRNQSGLAKRLFPFTEKAQMLQAQAEASRTVVIDPAVSFGMPVLADSRITTGFLASRYRGGDSISMLAKDYGRKEREIEEALIWERAKQAA